MKRGQSGTAPVISGYPCTILTARYWLVGFDCMTTSSCIHVSGPFVLNCTCLLNNISVFVAPVCADVSVCVCVCVCVFGELGE